MNNLTFLKQQISELTLKSLQLENEVEYLKGKIEAYEWFLKNKSFMKDEE